MTVRLCILAVMYVAALEQLVYLAVGGKYIGLLLTGKRKSSNTKQMLKEAADRKRIYSSLNLFK